MNALIAAGKKLREHGHPTDCRWVRGGPDAKIEDCDCGVQAWDVALRQIEANGSLTDVLDLVVRLARTLDPQNENRKLSKLLLTFVLMNVLEMEQPEASEIVERSFPGIDPSILEAR